MKTAIEAPTLSLTDGAPHQDVQLRPASEADAARVKRLAESGTAVCSPGARGKEPLSDGFRAGRQPAIVAVGEDGELQGIAWLQLDEPQPTPFGVVVLPGFRRTGGASALLRELAAEARRHGHQELLTTIVRGLPDPLLDLRESGLRVVSAFTTGGISDVRIALD